jgi:hypothetical protein
MRTRLLRPSFFTNAELVALPPLARIFFAGLWCAADREGRLLDQPGRLRLLILPADPCSGEEMLALLAAAEPPFIVRYRAGKQRLIWIPAFRAQQGYGIHPREKQSDFPPCDSDECVDCRLSLSKPFHCNGSEVAGESPALPSYTSLPSGTSSKEEEHPKKDACSEPVPKPASEPPVLVFPTVGKGKKQWSLIEAKLAEYRESFPGVDVLAECRKALQWCRDNPTKRKTARGMPAFLTRWLGKAQNAGRAASNGKAGPPPETPEQRTARLARERKARGADEPRRAFTPEETEQLRRQAAEAGLRSKKEEKENG